MPRWRDQQRASGHKAPTIARCPKCNGNVLRHAETRSLDALKLNDLIQSGMGVVEALERATAVTCCPSDTQEQIVWTTKRG